MIRPQVSLLNINHLCSSLRSIPTSWKCTPKWTSLTTEASQLPNPAQARSHILALVPQAPSLL
jgi:hypothetical protein